MVRDSVQLETAVNTITHEYLLEFTSEYGISEVLCPELPGPGDRIVDFPEGKMGCRRVVPIPWSCEGAGYASYPYPKTTGGATVFGWYKPPILSWGRCVSEFSIMTMTGVGILCLNLLSLLEARLTVFFLIVEMDLFSLIRAPNPTKVKTGSRPRAPHELPLLTLTASLVIEMDEPAAATDSFGVPSAIEKSSLDFADEAEASGQETAAPEVPPPKEVPISTVPGGDQAAPVVVEPPTVQDSRKRGREEIDANAPSKSLRRDHANLQPSGSSRGGRSLAAMQLCLASNIFMYEGVPADVSDPDPLAFADGPSPHHADVIRSSQGVAAVGDPGSENVSSPTEVGSSGSVYRPEWGVTNGSLLDTPEACGDGFPIALEVRAGCQATAEVCCSSGSPRIKNLSSGVKNKESGSVFSELQVSNERLSQLVDALQQQVSGEETLKATFRDYKRQQDKMVEQRPQVRYRAWAAPRNDESLKDLKLPLLDQLEGLKDAPMDVILASLYLEDDTGDDAPQFMRDLRPSSSQLAIPVYPEVRDPRNPWACTEEIKLADAIAANISRAEQKKRSRIVCQTHGVGSAHHARSDRVLVSAPIVVP
uniref:Uncharacterized protein n=1 Tax=Tanacetum cinerariifolium TaxID=118510 RepID=A0A6L2NHE8_TANCI|nr:hypothetical protein [Tanacetum cinerariifolium]